MYFAVTTISSAQITSDNTQNDSFARRISDTDGGRDGFAHRVERARADVAVDDADAAERQRPKSRGWRFMRRGFRRERIACSGR